MEKLGQQIEYGNSKEKVYIDSWCARNVRKVSSCSQCLHYEECKKLGQSISPRALKHRGIKIKNHWGNDEDD